MHCVRTIFSNLRKSQCKVLSARNVISMKHNVKIRQYSIATVEDESEKSIDAICNGDPDLEKKLRILMLEVEVMRQDGRCAPNTMQTKNWKHLMELASRNQRISYLTYLFKTEKSKENEKAKKETRRKKFEETGPEVIKEFSDDVQYGLQQQSLFLRIRDQSINNFDNYKALQAMMYGQSLVIDCSYDKHMIHREMVNAAKQLTFVFGDNRIHKEPFNIHLCNVEMNGTFMKQLHSNIPSLNEPWFPLNISTKSYLDIFPKEQLVYLTPHCREELTTFDHDAVYIIGCMVDKMNNDPLSLAKAKRDGIKMAKLPLDRYLEWAPGSKKNLNINHMVPILLDLKTTGDWEFALKHIPRRKLMETKILAMQKKLKNPMLQADVFRNLRKQSKSLSMTFKDKRTKSRQSLYDDDKI